MSYAFVQDVSASWEQYEQVTAALLEPPPVGLILHVAGPTEEGFRIIALWESEPFWQRFQAERLAPAIAALGGPARPQPTFRGLHPAHVVSGAVDMLKTTAPSDTPHSERVTVKGGSTR